MQKDQRATADFSKHVTHGNNESLDVLWQCHHIHFVAVVVVVVVDPWPPGSSMSA